MGIRTETSQKEVGETSIGNRSRNLGNISLYRPEKLE